MLEKYRHYRNKCREMHERLKANADDRSLGEELEKRDQELMQAIRRSSVLEEQLRAKDEELELGKGVSTECEHLQAKVGKLAELERKVSVLENIESAWASASARAAALEDTIRVLQSEQESERATATLREARFEECIGDIDREASTLGDRVAALEAEKAQLLAKVEFASAAVPRHLHELWAAYEGARAKAREARVNYGYDPTTPEADEDVDAEKRLPEDGDEEDVGGYAE
ncbi:uncharacterized protein [Nicotiana sylvestris]|uniref:uncharacterized protein n=1 Tax=Nicotiana sylvestris TaxID=4096 RepID=UPI00388C97EB